MAEKIKGYRTLSDEEIAVINEIKAMGNQVGVLVERLMNEANGEDKRWVAEGRTDLQKGFMSLVRAVARPEFF